MEQKYAWPENVQLPGAEDNARSVALSFSTESFERMLTGDAEMLYEFGRQVILPCMQALKEAVQDEKDVPLYVVLRTVS